jgi:predicted transcriptional regulator YdeE
MAQPAGKLEGPLEPRFENGRAMLIAGLGGRYGNETRAQLPDLWQRFGPRYFGRVPGQVDKKAYGVCSNMDDKGNMDYLAGVEFSSSGLPEEFIQLSLAPRRYAVFGHADHISSIARTPLRSTTDSSEMAFPSINSTRIKTGDATRKRPGRTVDLSASALLRLTRLIISSASYFLMQVDVMISAWR